jgi:hypothetical protein
VHPLIWHGVRAHNLLVLLHVDTKIRTGFFCGAHLSIMNAKQVLTLLLLNLSMQALVHAQEGDCSLSTNLSYNWTRRQLLILFHSQYKRQNMCIVCVSLCSCHVDTHTIAMCRKMEESVYTHAHSLLTLQCSARSQL